MQAHRDIDALHRLKEEALRAPEAFLRRLGSREECERLFPKMQTISAVPDMSMLGQQRRSTRRSSTRYGQNFGKAVRWAT